ncbi:helix-turn-helix transcriptional regulator [Kitasatospora sp. GP82]|uniref:helix-turn-helix transcriptional regulator n=1 Tax=Kitasatospora sp. GP82 TaxID=3035089 RepID=UPI0024753372|nr:helix-turn-helix transcriptional regulator [Kitasatospora sp. GP82]MDH6125928.1 transcriptional regulator with XRE-family HTH domain [Kitasatospora sp. GP82]
MADERIRVRRTPPAGLGPMLGEARLRAGYGLREFARLVGLSHSYVIQLETGKRCPSVTVARRIAAVLALTEDEMVPLRDAAVDDAGRDHPARRSASAGAGSLGDRTDH